MENIKKKESIQTSEELTALQKENEELKEVLSAVQIDLEAKTEVGIRFETEIGIKLKLAGVLNYYSDFKVC